MAGIVASSEPPVAQTRTEPVLLGEAQTENERTCAVCLSWNGGFDTPLWTSVSSFSASELLETFHMAPASDGLLCKTCRAAVFFMRKNTKNSVFDTNFAHYVGRRMNDDGAIRPGGTDNQEEERRRVECRERKRIWRIMNKEKKAEATATATSGEEVANTLASDVSDSSDLADMVDVQPLDMSASPAGKASVVHFSTSIGNIPLRSGAVPAVAMGPPPIGAAIKTSSATISTASAAISADSAGRGVGAQYAVAQNRNPVIDTLERPASAVELPGDVIECEHCGGRGERRLFIPSGRFCTRACMRSFSSTFRLAKLAIRRIEPSALANYVAVKKRRPKRDKTMRSSSPRNVADASGGDAAAAPSDFVFVSRRRAKKVKQDKRPRLLPPDMSVTAVTAVPAEKKKSKTPDWEPYYDRESNDLYLSRTYRTPLTLAAMGLLRRRRDAHGNLLIERPYAIPAHLEDKERSLWTAADVHAYIMVQDQCCKESADLLLEHEVDGEVFAEIKLSQLITTLNMKVGPALKLQKMGTSLNLESMR